MSVAHRRDLARQAVSERHCSQRQACHYFNLHRSSYPHRMKYPKQVRQQVEEAIVRQSLEHPELGADKIGRLVRNHGMRVSNQRVRTLHRNEGLTVPSPKKKQCRRGASTGKAPQKASYRGLVWSWDFIHDRTVRRGSCRILSIVDEFTRECHLLHVDRSIGSKNVKEQLIGLIEEHGTPDYVRSDNGPEFIGKVLCKWIAQSEIKTLYIEPGCPWQNGYVESFHDKFRRERLARELFFTHSECRVVVTDSRRKYNKVRPHRSLGMRTPAEFARTRDQGTTGGRSAPKVLANENIKPNNNPKSSHLDWAKKWRGGKHVSEPEIRFHPFEVLKRL